MATTSEATVCNLALAAIGHTQPIVALTDQTEEGGACALHYPQDRDELLRMVRWSFAKRRASLTLLATPTRPEWVGAYLLPADCLAVRAVFPGASSQRIDDEAAFDIETDATVGQILL